MKFTGRSTHILIRALAIIALVTTIWLNILLWPVPFLGFSYDMVTGKIVGVENHSASDIAGILPGDHIVRIYNHTFEDVMHNMNLLSLIGNPGDIIPITVKRNENLIDFNLSYEQPSFDFQTFKIVMLILAAVCWATGYFLGISRRNELMPPPSVPIFWFSASIIFGSYMFAVCLSLPLRFVIQWIIITLMVPLAVYIHIIFPLRALTKHRKTQSKQLFISLFVLFNSALAAYLWYYEKSLTEAVRQLGTTIPILTLLGFILISYILMKDYRETNVEHTKRQIRMIIFSCLIVTIFWVFAFIIPIIIRGPSIIDQRLLATLSFIPFAYLAGGITKDLYRIDRIIRRLTLHATTILILTLIILLLDKVISIHNPSNTLLLATLFIISYKTTQNIILKLIPILNVYNKSYQDLHKSIAKLTETLDTKVLTDFIVEGISLSFGQPAIAFYLVRDSNKNKLSLAFQDRLSYLSEEITLNTQLKEILQNRGIVEIKTLQSRIRENTLHLDEEEMILHSGAVLWCTIVHSQGYLLGLLMLGMRGDLDPYRPEDINELQRLMDAASLAFTNSISFSKQRESENIIRKLYRRLQQTQDDTAANIVREIHDEVINGTLLWNVQAIERKLTSITDENLREDLSLILQTEQSAITSLRMISQSLRPTGIDDPLGLSSVLRTQVERIKFLWFGETTLTIQNNPVPIEAPIQHAAMQITREALTNAVKHAEEASRIDVILKYPNHTESLIELTIKDDGKAKEMIAPKFGHWGIINMEERAMSVGGTFQIHVQPEVGTSVIFQFKPSVVSDSSES